MDKERLKKVLQAKERDLVAQIALLRGDAMVGGDTEVRDTSDDAVAAQSSSEALQEESIASETLAEVRGALHRMENGTYGKCVDCGRTIDDARLNAVPWAEYCIEDQEQHDKEDHAAQGGSTL